MNNEIQVSYFLKHVVQNFRCALTPSVLAPKIYDKVFCARNNRFYVILLQRYTFFMCLKICKLFI